MQKTIVGTFDLGGLGNGQLGQRRAARNGPPRLQLETAIDRDPTARWAGKRTAYPCPLAIPGNGHRFEDPLPLLQLPKPQALRRRRRWPSNAAPRVRKTSIALRVSPVTYLAAIVVERSLEVIGFGKPRQGLERVGHARFLASWRSVELDYLARRLLAEGKPVHPTQAKRRIGCRHCKSKGRPVKSLVGLQVFRARSPHDLIRQRRRRAVLVPASRFQPVADELLVERRRIAADLVAGRPARNASCRASAPHR